MIELDRVLDSDTIDVFGEPVVVAIETIQRCLPAHDADVREKERRKFMWLHHGHTAALYGDDGEMQCSPCRCDYKRDPISQVEEKWQAAIEAISEQAKREQMEADAITVCKNHALGHAQTKCPADAIFAAWDKDHPKEKHDATH